MSTEDYSTYEEYKPGCVDLGITDEYISRALATLEPSFVFIRLNPISKEGDIAELIAPAHIARDWVQ